METIVIVVHMLAALAIIGLILLQQGKGAEMGASFGSGASQTLFGSQGSGNFFSRSTAAIAVIFFATSFGLAIIAKNKADVGDEFQLSVPVDEIPVEVDSLSEVPETTSDASEVPAAEMESTTDTSEVPTETTSEVPAEEIPASENN